MQNRIGIDRKHSRAIANEIGERLRLHLGRERRAAEKAKASERAVSQRIGSNTTLERASPH